MPRYYRVDHRHLFAFGYFFYLLTPIFIGTTTLFEGLPGIDLYREFFAMMQTDKLNQYLIITFCWLPSFYLGHACFSLLGGAKKRGLALFEGNATTYAVSYIGMFLFAVLILFAFISRGSLFGGYGSYDIAARGKMSTLLVIFNFFLLYQLVSRQKLSMLIALGTSLTCILLLSMGGRMYVFQAFIAFLVFKTSFSEQRWNWRQLFLFALIGLFVGSAFGLWRMGTNLNAEKAAYSFLAEPSFTWFSTISYLNSNEIPLFNFPSNFITSFLNLVPNTFFSFKPYIVSTASMVQNYQNPLGADSVWSTFVINFGSVGSCLFIFICGFLLNLLRYQSSKTRFSAVYYIMVCGILPFQFFRDGFYILNKQLFFNFLLLPGMLLAVTNLLIYIGTRVPRKKLPDETVQA
jgi:hypothetical protein